MYDALAPAFGLSVSLTFFGNSWLKRLDARAANRFTRTNVLPNRISITTASYSLPVFCEGDLSFTVRSSPILRMHSACNSARDFAEEAQTLALQITRPVSTEINLAERDRVESIPPLRSVDIFLPYSPTEPIMMPCAPMSLPTFWAVSASTAPVSPK